MGGGEGGREVQRQPSERENIFASYIPDKELISKI